MAATKNPLAKSFKWSVQLDVNWEDERLLFLLRVKHTVTVEFEFEFHT